MITTKALALEAFGAHSVHDYEQVKAFYMRLGHELAHGFAAAVDGHHGLPGTADVHTRLGVYEFRASWNTKNHAGDAADRNRGTPVVACGTKAGCLSGEEFLEQHGVPALMANIIRRSAAMRARQYTVDQLLLPIWGDGRQSNPRTGGGKQPIG